MGQSHSHFILNFEAVSLTDDLIVLTSSCNDNSSHRNLTTWFGEQPVQQELVFFLFFLTITNENNKVMGCAGGAQHGHALTNEREQNIGLRADRARGKIKTASEVY